ncbi:MAG: hypothetical protein ACPGVG_10265 [Mycobacterium sp.]
MPIRTGFVVDDQAPKADKLNAGFRWTGYDTLRMFAAKFLADVAPAEGGYVLGGLKASAAGGGAAATTVQAGAAIHRSAATYAAVLDGEDTANGWGLTLLEADTDVAHTDNASGSTRVDLVAITSTVGTDRPESVQQDGGSTTSQDTRWGHETSLVVTAGTPGAGVPATPTGHTVLYQVSIPNGTTGANWSANTTYTDVRQGKIHAQFVPAHGSEYTASVDNGDITIQHFGSYLSFVRTGTTGQEDYQIRQALSLPARETWVNGCTFYYDVATAFDGTITTQSLTLVVVNGTTGAGTTIGTGTLALGSTGTKSVSLTMTSTPSIGVGEFVYLLTDIDLAADGTQGTASFYGFDLSIGDGRSV